MRCTFTEWIYIQSHTESTFKKKIGHLNGIKIELTLERYSAKYTYTGITSTKNVYKHTLKACDTNYKKERRKNMRTK